MLLPPAPEVPALLVDEGTTLLGESYAGDNDRWSILG